MTVQGRGTDGHLVSDGGAPTCSILHYRGDKSKAMEELWLVCQKLSGGHLQLDPLLKLWVGVCGQQL